MKELSRTDLNIIANEFSDQKMFWENKFIELNEITYFLGDNYKSTIIAEKFDEIGFLLPEHLSNKLFSFSKDSDLALYVFLLSTVNILQYKFSGNSDVVTSIPLLKSDQENSINPKLISRIKLNSTQTFREVIRQFKGEVLDIYNNKSYPLSLLTDNNNIVVNNVIVALDNIHQPIEQAIDKCCFLFSVINNNIKLKLRYKTECYAKEYIKILAQSFFTLLEQVLDNSDKELKNLNLITSVEKERILDFNRAEEYCPQCNVINLFDEKAESIPYKVAIKCNDLQLTYSELDKQSNLLANQLLGNVQLEEAVTLFIDRSVDSIISILGVLKSGCAYVPIDVDTPLKRLWQLMSECNSKILITNQEGLDHGGTVEIINISKIITGNESCIDISLPDVLPNNLAYIIFTSGSTGKPKGVAIEHKSIVNLVNEVEHGYLNEEGILNLSLLSPYSFDASVKQIFPALTLGHTLIIASDEERLDVDKLVRFYKRNQIEISDGTPFHLNLLTEKENDNLENIGIRKFVIGGDRLPLDKCQQLFDKISNPRLEVINVYGPTECCDITSFFSLNRENIKMLGQVPIGTPLKNVQCFVLSNECDFLPVGSYGELFVSGVCLARNYVNSDDETLRKFITNPFCPNSRLYRTGDIVKWNKKGELEYFGRTDAQVKINGVRIELDELKNTVLGIDEITDAYVRVKDKHGERKLCLYYVSEKYDEHLLKTKLLEYLPYYLLPEFLIKLSEIPYNNRGKIDALKLSQISIKKKDSPLFEKAINSNEKKLVEIWKQILAIEMVGINDNFFDLGGNSVKIVLLSEKINKEFNMNIKVVDLFNYPTIKSITTNIFGGIIEEQEDNKEMNEFKENRKRLLNKRRNG